MTGALGYLTRPGRPGRTRTQGSHQGMSPEEHDTLQGPRVSSGQYGWCNPALCSSCPHSERRMTRVTPWPPGRGQLLLARTLWILLRHFTPGKRVESGGCHHFYRVELYSGPCDHCITSSSAANGSSGLHFTSNSFRLSSLEPSPTCFQSLP